MRPTITVLAFVLVLSSFSDLALAEDEAQPLSDDEIRTLIDLGCGGRHPAENYRGLADFDVFGPLWLAKPREERPRGVILTAPLRVYLLARGRRCGKITIDEAREFAGAEIWVVLWRFEDPPGEPGQSRVTSGQTVFTPTEVRYRADGAWHQPLWTRTKDSQVAAWYWQDWNEREGLIAAFPTLHRSGALHTDYRIEEKGQSYLTGSEIFTLSYSDKWWQAAFEVPRD